MEIIILEHRDERNKYNKQYYLEHREELNEKHKQYNLDNAEKINEKKRVKYNCECGGKYTYSVKARHLKSKKHLNYVNPITT